VRDDFAANQRAALCIVYVIDDIVVAPNVGGGMFPAEYFDGAIKSVRIAGVAATAGTRLSSNHSPKEHVMKSNVGSVDRALRVIVGLCLIAASLFGWIGPWGWIGLLFVGTGVVAVCPAYVPFGWNTCHSSTASKAPR